MPCMIYHLTTRHNYAGWYVVLVSTVNLPLASSHAARRVQKNVINFRCIVSDNKESSYACNNISVNLLKQSKAYVHFLIVNQQNNM